MLMTVERVAQIVHADLADTASDLLPVPQHRQVERRHLQEQANLPTDDAMRQMCEEVVSREQCAGPAIYGVPVAKLCPDVCTSTEIDPNAPGKNTTDVLGQSAQRLAGENYVASCLVLLALPGGCSHDLSLHDSTIARGTRVSDFCSDECSGHAGCAPSDLDIGFVGDTADSSGADVEVSLVGDACVDGGGVSFSGDGRGELTLGKEYASDATFTLAFWLLKTEVSVLNTQYESGFDIVSTETIFSHPVRSSWIGCEGHLCTTERHQSHFGIEVSLLRGAWLDSWALVVYLDEWGIAAQVELMRDFVPKWSHIAVVVDGTYVTVHQDGRSLTSHAVNLALDGMPHYLIAEDSSEVCPRFYKTETITTPQECIVATEYLGLESNAGRSSTNNRGFGGEGATAANNCWAGMVGATNFNSAPRHDPLPNRGKSICKSQAVSPTAWNMASQIPAGFRVAVSLLTEVAFLGSNADGSYVTMQQLIQYDGVGRLVRVPYPSTSEVKLGGSTFGITNHFHGSIAMVQIYAAALTKSETRCVHESGRQLVQSGRLAQDTSSACRGPVSMGCTSRVASGTSLVTTNTVRTPAVSMVDDGSCKFDEQTSIGERGIINVTDTWQLIQLRGVSYNRPLVFCGVLSRQSTAQAVVRLQNVQMNSGGAWSFEVRAEQESCHFAEPPPTQLNA
jgi:hypothetical protein